MFRRLSLPDSGITQEWFANVRTLDTFIKEQTAAHGCVVTRLVERHADRLRGSAQGAWAIREQLIQMSLTLDFIQGQLTGVALAKCA
jgi:hypothetical protein